jgi:flavin reductase (DIM6/NTAB) family NADH-FMN oxidoreductase RutF
MLIGCGSVDEPNLITCSWFGTVASEPPQVAVGVRESRHSHGLIKNTGEFTAIAPSKHQLDAVKHCGSASGRDENKLNVLGLTAVACPPLKSAPMIQEAEIVLACDVRESVELGSHTLFIGEVVAVYGHESRIRVGAKRVDPRPDDQLVYLDGRYWSLVPAE